MILALNNYLAALFNSVEHRTNVAGEFRFCDSQRHSASIIPCHLGSEVYLFRGREQRLSPQTVPGLCLFSLRITGRARAFNAASRSGTFNARHAA